MTARIAAVLLILLTTNALALDNEIKVLVVMAPGALLDNKKEETYLHVNLADR